jgi:phage terminase large subunit
MAQRRNSTTYYHVRECSTRIQVHQGGTRSGKTYSIVQSLIEFCYLNQNAGQVIAVVRKTYPALKSTVLRDFVEILMGQGWYDETKHNKTDQVYNLFGNRVEFFSLDQPQKVRGRKRHVLYCNEANELTKEDWRQLTFRTTWKIILDYNPSEPFHWIYSEVIPREDCSFFKTTYKDNPFLEPELVAEIERLKDADPDYWRVYGLGERASNRKAVYLASQGEKVGKFIGYGLDWGFTNDPTALVGIYSDGTTLHVEELIYKRGLTNSEIIAELKALGVGRRDYIIADSAEPKSIEEIKRAGFLIRPAQKGPDSIRQGIDIMKRHKLTYTGDNVEREFMSYKWKEDKEGNLVNSPEDKHNHALDAARYVCLNLIGNKKSGRYVYS